MKKVILCICVIFFTSFSSKPVSAVETTPSASTKEASINNYIKRIYNQIDFGVNSHMEYAVFEKAYRGYMNLRSAGKLNSDKQLLTVCDFTKSSIENRMWIIDLCAKKVLFNTYVAHGQGSGDEFATNFSNNLNSHQSSIGFYVTGDTYPGEHGTSLRLFGMDEGFNSSAYDRGIVVHGANYVCDKFVAGNQRLGRSWGCPAVPSKLSPRIINEIKEGTCLFIYYPEKDYLRSSYWINKKMDNMPEDNMFPEFKKTENATVLIQYVSNGKLDSVKSVPASSF